jgi:capsular exopolysaccharide synthesis family protein
MTICITSSIGGEGKTFSSMNLAANFSQNNKKTILLSLDLRKPRIHKSFNLSNAVGISTYLIGRSTYEEIIVQTNISNLYVATSGPVPPNPAELLGSKAMESFMERVKSEFDIIVMDTPPLAFVIDSLLMSRFADITIYVIRQNYTSRDVFKLINDQHFKGNLPNLGILINDVKLSPYSYGKRYSYGYIYNYGYGNGKSTYYGEVEEKTTWLGKIKKILLGGFRLLRIRD